MESDDESKPSKFCKKSINWLDREKIAMETDETIELNTFATENSRRKVEATEKENLSKLKPKVSTLIPSRNASTEIGETRLEMKEMSGRSRVTAHSPVTIHRVHDDLDTRRGHGKAHRTRTSTSSNSYTTKIPCVTTTKSESMVGSKTTAQMEATDSQARTFRPELTVSNRPLKTNETQVQKTSTFGMKREISQEADVTWMKPRATGQCNPQLEPELNTTQKPRRHIRNRNVNQNRRKSENDRLEQEARGKDESQFQTLIVGTPAADNLIKKESAPNKKPASQFILTAADGIFPGFLEKYKAAHRLISHRNSAIVHRWTPAVRIRSSLPVQLMMYASWGYFMVYLVCALGTLDITLKPYKRFHVVTVVLLKILCFTLNLWRYSVGMTANMHDDALNMTWYWMLTLSQLPVFILVLLSDVYPTALTLIVTLDIIAIAFIFAELLISLLHTHRLLAHEVMLMTRAQVIETNPPPRVRNTRNGPVVEAARSDHQDSQHGSEFETESEGSTETTELADISYNQFKEGIQFQWQTEFQETRKPENVSQTELIDKAIKTLFYPPHASDQASSNELEEPDSEHTKYSDHPVTSNSDSETNQSNVKRTIRQIPNRRETQTEPNMEDNRIASTDYLNPVKSTEHLQVHQSNQLQSEQSDETLSTGGHGHDVLQRSSTHITQSRANKSRSANTNGNYDFVEIESLPAGPVIREKETYTDSTIATVTSRKGIPSIYKSNSNSGGQLPEHIKFQGQHETLETELKSSERPSEDQRKQLQPYSLKRPSDDSSSSISELGDTRNNSPTSRGVRACVLKVEELSSSGSSNSSARRREGQYSRSKSNGKNNSQFCLGKPKSSSSTSFDEETSGNGSTMSRPFSNLSLLEAKQQRYDLGTAISLPSAGSVSSSNMLQEPNPSNSGTNLTYAQVARKL